jgi:hypothetical protein
LDGVITLSDAAVKNERVDLGGARVLFINDLEKDPQYSRFPRSLEMLKYSTKGGLRPLARNIVTVVFVLNPLDQRAVEILSYLFK